MLIELEAYIENSRSTGPKSQQQPFPPLADLECSDMTGFKSQRGSQLLTKPKAALGEAKPASH